MEKNYDAIVGDDVTITANRSLYVDFTMPFTDLGLGMIVPITNSNNDMWIFLKPLTTELWVTSAVFFILIGFVVWVIEHRINAQFQGSPTQQIGTVFWFSFSTLVFAHRETLQSNLSKFVVMVWLFVVLILSSSYTATLTSMLTVQQIQLWSANYIGYHLDSVISKGVVMNFNFTDPRIRPYISPEEYIDALSRGSKNAGVSAIIEEIPYIKIIIGRYPTRYTMIEPTFTSNGFAFALLLL